MEIILGAFGLAIIGLIIYVATLAKMAERARAREEDLDEWSGVYDVKREVDKRLSDPAERERMRDKYNKN